MKFTEKTQKNQFLSFANISSSNEPRGRANHWEMNTFGIGKSQIFFEIFLSVGYDITSENPKNQFSSFPNISSSNKPRVRANL